MAHEIHQVKSCEALENYSLKIRFEDNSEQIIDFSPLLKGELFSPLKDLALFRSVKVDPETETIQWPNGADFDPETLYHWPKYKNELIEKLSQ